MRWLLILAFLATLGVACGSSSDSEVNMAENVVLISLEELEAAAEDRSKLDPKLSDPNVQVITT